VYNITLWRVCATIVAEESSMYYIFWVCVCSFGYTACNAHAPYYIVICGLSGSTVFFHLIPYCHVWPVRLYSSFSHYFILSHVACPALQYFSTLSHIVMCGLSGSTVFFHIIPYCHMWPVRLYNFVPHYLINGMIFEKKMIEHKMCVLIFSKPLVWKISLSKKNWARYDQKSVLAVMKSARYSCHFLR
jgi:hypothetical protein